MRDLKDKRPQKFKSNRRKTVRQPRDWKKLFRWLQLLAVPFKRRENRCLDDQQPRDWTKILHRTFTVGVVCGGAALTVTGGLMLWEVVTDSRFFRVETIRVEQMRRVAADDIRELSDIQPGMNIFSLDLELIGRKIAENPWIADARVERVFPREIVIRVSEHEPMAIANLGCLYYVDRDGTVFKPLGVGDRVDYPVVTGIDRQFLLDQPEEARRLLAEAMSLLQELGGRRIFGLDQISEVHIDPIEGYDLYTLLGGIPVRLGFSDFSSKLDRLERIYTELVPRFAVLQSIDLNVVDRVIVKVDASLTLNKEENPGRKG